MMATFLALLAILLAADIHVERERAGSERRDPRRRVGATPRETRRHPLSWLSTSAEFPFPPRDGQWVDSAGKIWPPVLLQDGFGSRGSGPRLQRVRGDAQSLAARPSTAPGRCSADRVVNGGSTLLTTAQPCSLSSWRWAHYQTTMR